MGFTGKMTDHGNGAQRNGAANAAMPAADAQNSAAQSSSAALAADAQNGGFKRTLGIFDMVIYGLIFMVPIAPFSIFGGVFDASNGMPALAYLIAFVAMLFTVFSFGIMIRTFPSSGSIYTYTTKSIGKGIGFIAGWLMLLQYLVSPDVVFTIAAEPLNHYVPAIPVWGWCMIFLIAVLLVATRGIKTTMTVNRIALICEFIVLGMFLVFAVIYIVQHPDTTGFSLNALFDPQKFNASGMMSAVSLAVFSFVGFGCVATLTEEAKDERHGPSRAMLIMVVILAVLFSLTCFVATCADPSGELSRNNVDNGFYLIAERVGGVWFGQLCAIAVALSQGLFTGLVAQVSVSRILYTMARSGSLPKALTKMDEKRGVPIVATVFVSVMSLVLLPFFLNVGMDGMAKVANFGALSTYCLLNICVVWHFWVRLKEHNDPVRMLILPVIGAIVTAAVFCSLDTVTHIIGFAWIAVGIVYYLVTKFVLKRDVDFSE